MILTELGEFDVLHNECVKAAQDVSLQMEAAFAIANATATQHEFDVDAVLPPLQRFIEQAPQDDRAATLLFRCAQYGTEDHSVRRELLSQMLEAYPESFYAQYATGMLRQLDGIGQPFELVFQDALTDQQISVEQMQGKIIVVDFWATWCGPCLGEMPHLKELYAKYHPEGVEFIGVSLDVEESRGGKDQLIQYCQQNQLTWPQYYQGAKYDSEFSHGWGISSIPRAFLIDWEGKLRSVDARGKLDELIPQLLKQRDASQR